MADVTAYEVALLEENSRLRAEVEKLRAARDAVVSVADSGLLPDGDGVNTPTLMWLESVRAALAAKEG